MAEYTREEVLELVKVGSSLIGANLGGMDLSGADLNWANLKGANLKNVDFRETILYQANLRLADLREADLSRANLSRADLSRADLSFADLIEADLIEADLSRADLRGADLSGADLSFADLRGADLRGANLMGADLSRAKLIEANLRFADLMGADLTAAVLRDTYLSSADLEGAILNNADISGANIYHIKTPGWKIENIICTHIYRYNPYNPFTTDEDDREKKRNESRREFGEGEFEAIHKSMPTIELWFKEGFSLADELRLMYIQDRLQREAPDAHISLKKKEWVGKDMVITLTVEEEDKAKEAAEAVDRLYGDKGLEEEFLRRMEDAFNKKLFQSIPGMNQAITSGSGSDDKRGSPVTINNNLTIICQSGEGHSAVLADTVDKSPIGPGASVNIIRNYQNNRPAVDVLLKELRAGLAEDRKAFIDQFTDALKARDEGEVKSSWEKISSVIGTVSNGVAIANGLKTLLGL